MVPILTTMISTPLPDDYTNASLKLLSLIKTYKNDEVLKQKPIIYFLMRKWQSHAKVYFYYQSAALISLLLSACIFFNADDNFTKLFVGILAICLNFYFTLYEIIQCMV
jgi:hypothetical protein